MLANPTCLDGPDKLLNCGVKGQVGQIVFALFVRAMFADQPDSLARQLLGSHIIDALGVPPTTRMRKTEKRLNGCIFIPSRQLKLYYFACPRIAHAPIGNISLTGMATLGDGKNLDL